MFHHDTLVMRFGFLFRAWGFEGGTFAIPFDDLHSLHDLAWEAWKENEARGHNLYLDYDLTTDPHIDRWLMRATIWQTLPDMPAELRHKLAELINPTLYLRD